MQPGVRVEVRNRFDGSWAPGFVLEDEGRNEDGRVAWRKVRRASDGMVIPASFRPSDVRPERRGSRAAFY